MGVTPPGNPPEDALERVHVQVGLGQQPLELGVLGFEFTQALGLRDLHAAELGAPLNGMDSLV